MGLATGEAPLRDPGLNGRGGIDEEGLMVSWSVTCRSVSLFLLSSDVLALAQNVVHPPPVFPLKFHYTRFVLELPGDSPFPASPGCWCPVEVLPPLECGCSHSVVFLLFLPPVLAYPP